MTMTDMTSASPPLLSIESVSKAYDTTQALDDVTIDIRPNEFVMDFM